MLGSPRFSGSLGPGPLEELLVLSPGSSTMEWAAEGVLAPTPLAVAGGGKAGGPAPSACLGQDPHSEPDAMELVYSGQPVGVLRQPSEVAGAVKAAGVGAAAAGVPGGRLQPPCGVTSSPRVPGHMEGAVQQGGPPMPLPGYPLGGAAGRMGPLALPGSSCAGVLGTGVAAAANTQHVHQQQQQQQLGWGGATSRQLQHAHSWPNGLWEQQRQQQEEQGMPCSGSPVAPACPPPLAAGLPGVVSPTWGTGGRNTPRTPHSIGSPSALAPAALRRSMSYPASDDGGAAGGRPPTTPRGRGAASTSYPGTPSAGAAGSRGSGVFWPGLLPPGGLPSRPPPLAHVAGGPNSGWGTAGATPGSPGAPVMKGVPMGDGAACASPLRPRLSPGLTGGALPPPLLHAGPAGPHHQRCMSLDAALPGQGVTFTLGANPSAPWARAARPTHRRCGSSGSMLPEGPSVYPLGRVTSPLGMLPGGGGPPGVGGGHVGAPLVQPPHPGLGGPLGPVPLQGIPVGGPAAMPAPGPPGSGSAGPYLHPVALGSGGPLLG